MLESVAKTKRCHRNMTMVCITSDCIAWEYYQELETVKQEEKPDGDGWQANGFGTWVRYVQQEDGFCQLLQGNDCSGCKL